MVIARALAAALMVATAIGSSAAQTVPATHPAVETHRSASRAERIDALHRALVAADAEALDRGRRAVERLRGPAPPLLGPPTAAQLNGWRRALDGSEPSDSAEAATFVDAVEVMAVPGAFEATTEDAARARFAVRLWAEAGTVVPREGVVRLYWIHDDGRRELARTAPFEGTAFRAPGFDLFIRAPATEPTTWRLVPEVELQDSRAFGVGIPIEAVADLEARWTAIRRGPAVVDLERTVLVSELELLLGAGVRTVRGAAVESMLASLEGARDELEPLEFDGTVVWTLGATERDGPVVVVVAAPDESPSAVFHGLRGLEWSRTMERVGGSVVALDADRAVGRDLALALDSLRELFPGRSTILAPRGASAALALLGAAAVGAEDVHWVVTRTGPRAPGGGLIGGLLIGPSSLGPLGDGAGFDLVEGASWPFAGELSLPRTIAEWWELRAGTGEGR